MTSSAAPARLIPMRDGWNQVPMFTIAFGSDGLATAFLKGPRH